MSTKTLELTILTFIFNLIQSKYFLALAFQFGSVRYEQIYIRSYLVATGVKKL